jgi:CD151 antigen
MPLMASLSYPLPSYLLLGAGLIGLLSATIGCCGIARSDKCFLLIYILLLLVVFLLQIMAGTLAYLYRDSAFTDLHTKLNRYSIFIAIQHLSSHKF